MSTEGVNQGYEKRSVWNNGARHSHVYGLVHKVPGLRLVPCKILPATYHANPHPRVLLARRGPLRRCLRCLLRGVKITHGARV